MITISHFCMTSGRHPSYSSSLLFLLYNFLTINIAAGNILSTLICQTDVSYFISLHDLILYVVTRYYHNILLSEDYEFIFLNFKHIFNIFLVNFTQFFIVLDWYFQIKQNNNSYNENLIKTLMLLPHIDIHQYLLFWNPIKMV